MSPDDKPDKPQFQLEALAIAAEQMHDMYLTYVAAGFSDSQAMQIILGMIQASMKP